MAAPDGPNAADKRARIISPAGGGTSILIFLNKIDQMDYQELLELVEMELRDMLTGY